MLVIVDLSACSSPPKEVPSRFYGTCKQLKVNHYLWQREPNFTGKYVINAFKRWPVGNRMLGDIPAGTRVIIKQVVLGQSGSWGHYFLVKVQIQDPRFMDLLVDIPTKVTLTEPYWVESTRPPDANTLYFNDAMVGDCPIK